MLGLLGFMLFNYLLAFFSPQQSVPIWFYYINPDKSNTETRVVRKYLSTQRLLSRALTVTIASDGGNGGAIVRSVVKNTGDTAYGERMQPILDEMGYCSVNGIEGNWQFKVKTYSFFNIPLNEVKLNCKLGLSGL